MHSEVSGPGKIKEKKEKKTCEMSPDWWCSLTQALLYNFSCGTRRRPLTLSQSVSFAPSPVSFLLPFYQFFFFQPNFFPSLPPPSSSSITSITRLSHPSVVFPAYPGLLLFFFKVWQACIHKWFAACWPVFQILLHQLPEKQDGVEQGWMKYQRPQSRVSCLHAASLASLSDNRLV